MFRLDVSDTKPWDGRYELETPFTTREWGWIKRLTGYLPGTIEEGFAGDDPELVVVLTVIALHRAGRIDVREVPGVFERIADMAGAKISIEGIPDPDDEGEGDDAGPPAASSTGSVTSSGEESPGSSETSGAPRNGSGTPGSAASASDPARLVT